MFSDANITDTRFSSFVLILTISPVFYLNKLKKKEVFVFYTLICNDGVVIFPSIYSFNFKLPVFIKRFVNFQVLTSYA